MVEVFSDQHLPWIQTRVRDLSGGGPCGFPEVGRRAYGHHPAGTSARSYEAWLLCFLQQQHDKPRGGGSIILIYNMVIYNMVV